HLRLCQLSPVRVCRLLAAIVVVRVARLSDRNRPPALAATSVGNLAAFHERQAVLTSFKQNHRLAVKTLELPVLDVPRAGYRLTLDVRDTREPARCRSATDFAIRHIGLL